MQRGGWSYNNSSIIIIVIIIIIMIMMMMMMVMVMVIMIIIIVIIEKKFSHPTMGGVILRLGTLPESWESENTSEDLRRS